MRVYKKRTNRENISEEAMKAAISLVLKNRDRKGFSIRSVAKMHHINYTTLSRYIKKCKSATRSPEDVDASDGDQDLTMERRKIPGQVFDDEHEGILIEYIRLCGRINCALRPKHARSLAYEYAVKFDIDHPSSWDKNKRAGEDWLTSFLRRNSSLLPFSAQAMRSRTASFNKMDGKKFFDTLKELYDRHNFAAENIYNMEESSVSTVVVLGGKVTTKKIGKQNSDAVTGEISGETISLATAVNAIGKPVPPVLIFPRKKYHHRFVQDGPAGCVGTGNASGTMTGETFLGFIKHFIKHAKPDETNPVLLIMDNNSTTHLGISVLDLCAKEGVTLLSLPPHSSQKLLPLRVAVSPAFKDYCKISVDDWSKRYPGKKMTVHDLPAIIKEPLIGAMTPSNIILGFAKTGIYPFKLQSFDAEMVAPQFLLAGGDLRPSPTTVDNLPLEYPDFGHLV